MLKSAIVHIWINLSRICKKKHISTFCCSQQVPPFFNHVTSLPLTTTPHRILKNIIMYWNIGLDNDNIIILYVISSWSFGRTLLVVRSYVSVVRSYVRSYVRSVGRTFGRTFGREPGTYRPIIIGAATFRIELKHIQTTSKIFNLHLKT